ncbi:MAG TPA: response regulator [Solirubrobacteraceae bacterium]|nr:response regulator [Solirubrobacteraceae bacterium]
MVAETVVTECRQEAATVMWESDVRSSDTGLFLSRPAAPDRTAAAPLAAPSAAAGGAARAPSVLIVDDDDSLREMLHELLERDGRLHVAGEARDGRDAIEAAARLRPDAILLDHQMPDLTGLEILPALRRQAPAAVVVMLSGDPDADLARRATEAGADAFFQKGTRLLHLLDSVVALVCPVHAAGRPL